MAVKLYYFDGRGLAEPIRWVLSYGGIDFEDIRAPVNVFPPPLPAEIKAKCRWGQVPLVEFDGKTLTQSVTILRYFARKTNLVPKDEYDGALCDEYIDSIKDMQRMLSSVLHEKDEEKKKALLEESSQKVKTQYLDKFESIIKENDGKHLVGNSLTWADIGLAFFLQHFHLLFGIELSSSHPHVKALRTMVESSPGIKEWLAKRPVTKF